MSSNEKISVIIPAYNAAKYIEEAIMSVLNQTYSGDIEIVVVNNGSTDNTYEVVEKIKNQHSNVFLYSKDFGCASTSRNLALKNFTGDYLIFHDADDIIVPDAVQKLYDTLKEQDADYVCALAKDFKSKELLKEGEPEPQYVSYTGALTGCILMKREVALNIGPFDEELSSGETVDWVLRLKDLKKKGVSLDYVTKLRRIHLTNTTKVAKLNYADALRKRLREARQK